MPIFLLHERRRLLSVAAISAIALSSLVACSGADPADMAAESTTPPMATSTDESEDVPWGYEGEGAPENWSELNPEYETCGTGMEQSPIDLVSADPLDLPDLAFDYFPSPWSVTNNGQAVQVTLDKKHSIELDDTDNELLQMHLHAPSEHLVGDESFAAEAHFVYTDTDDSLTVVGVLFEEADPNPVIEQILTQVPAGVDDVEQGRMNIDLTYLLPDSREYNTYSGSLTTPPCTEDVTWIVYTQPISASAEQIMDLKELTGSNSRPVQDLNGRAIEDDASVG